jgi:hypothetical protein
MRRKQTAWNLARGKKHGRYPWDNWFGKDKFTLRQGRDYACMQHGMAQMIRNVAARRAVRVAVKLGLDGRIDVTVLRPGVNR